jgi:hypothetical protein
MKFSVPRHLVAWLRRRAGFRLHDAVEFVQIRARPERREIIQGSDSSNLLRDGRGDELVEARPSSRAIFSASAFIEAGKRSA